MNVIMSTSHLKTEGAYDHHLFLNIGNKCAILISETIKPSLIIGMLCYTAILMDMEIHR